MKQPAWFVIGLAALVFLMAVRVHGHEEPSEDQKWVTVLSAENGNQTWILVTNRAAVAVPVAVRAFAPSVGQGARIGRDRAVVEQ